MHVLGVLLFLAGEAAAAVCFYHKFRWRRAARERRRRRKPAPPFGEQLRERRPLFVAFPAWLLLLHVSLTCLGVVDPDTQRLLVFGNFAVGWVLGWGAAEWTAGFPGS